MFLCIQGNARQKNDRKPHQSILQQELHGRVSLFFPQLDSIAPGMTAIKRDSSIKEQHTHYCYKNLVRRKDLLFVTIILSLEVNWSTSTTVQ